MNLLQVSKHVVALNISGFGDSPSLVKEMQRLSDRSVIDPSLSEDFVTKKTDKDLWKDDNWKYIVQPLN